MSEYLCFYCNKEIDKHHIIKHLKTKHDVRNPKVLNTRTIVKMG